MVKPKKKKSSTTPSPKRRAQRPRGSCGTRLKGTKYDFRVPNPPYCKLIHLPYTYQDEHGIQYYEPSAADPFVVRQSKAGVHDSIYWTLRPIVRDKSKPPAPLPRLGQKLRNLFSLQDGYLYTATVTQDYHLPGHATGWVALSSIQRQMT